MTASEPESAEARLDALLRPYRQAWKAQMEPIWNEFAAEHPESSFPSSQTMRRTARLFLAGKRYRFALAVAGYRLLTGERPSRDLERAATWLEWYHLYTLFLDDIMDEDVRRRTCRARGPRTRNCTAAPMPTNPPPSSGPVGT